MGHVDAENAVLATLDTLGIAYERIEIDPAFGDTADFCREYGYPVPECGNTILIASRNEPRQFAACVVRADTRLDVNRRVRKLMGVRKASFASAEDTVAHTGMAIGGVTAFALPEGLPIYVDAAVFELDRVILGKRDALLQDRSRPGRAHATPGGRGGGGAGGRGVK